MEKDSRSFFRHQLPLDYSLLDVPPDTNHLTTLGAGPLFQFSGIQGQNPEPNGSRNWFHGATHSPMAFAPALNSPFTEKPTAGPHEGGSPAKDTVFSQKRFLVFDHSGDRTTFLYTSGVQECGTYQMPKPPTSFKLNDKQGLQASMHPLRLTANVDEHFEDYSQGFTEDDMREDTEELDALLCSDSENYSSDGEETSTAHSPSTMTNSCSHVRELIEEEVDSFDFGSKRRKLFDGCHDVRSHGLAGSSMKSHVSSGLEEGDAVSSVGNGKEQGTKCFSSLSGSKRLRKERIHETVGVLQNIIPSAKGKDAIVVIDEAIHYLKSLKAKAMKMGLNSLSL